MATKVTIELTIGIPSAVVLYSVLGYGGAFNGGTKCSPKPVIDLDTSGSGSLTVPVLEWSTTNRYEDADALPVASRPAWFCALRAGASPVESKKLVRDPANLDVQFSQIGGATHAVKFIVVGANPLLTLAPAIDAEIVVGLRKSGGGIQYVIQGTHDGFPNYTVLINGRSVYAWDCVANSQDPSALGPPMDQTVSTGWKNL